MHRILFDSHCHLDDEQFDADRDKMITALPGQGIHACLTCGSDFASSRASLNLAERYAFVYAAAGIHPHEVSKTLHNVVDSVATMLQHEKVVALGEIGLDFHYDFSPRDIQEAFLIRQLNLAYELKKPVVLHVREAHGAMLDILRQRKGRLPSGVLHCFSGSAESASEYQELGFYISFAGSLTFKNTEKLRQAAVAVSLDRLLIETDSPYLSPVPFRGKRNDPSRVAEICRVLAEVREMPSDEMAHITCRNACSLFGLSDHIVSLQE